jgi:hypothetical protein
MNTLTVPKIKDLVNKPKEQYNDLFQTMQNGNNSMQGNSMQGNNNKNIETKNMTDELSSFLNDLKTTGNTIANANGNANGNANISEINNNNEIIGAADQFSGNGFSAF